MKVFKCETPTPTPQPIKSFSSVELFSSKTEEGVYIPVSSEKAVVRAVVLEGSESRSNTVLYYHTDGDLQPLIVSAWDNVLWNKVEDEEVVFDIKRKENQ